MSAVHRESYERHINSTGWRRVREAALMRDKYRCVECGSRDRLQIHHTNYASFGSESLNDVKTLCERCHRVADKQRRQQEATMIDTIQQQQWILETTGHVYQTTDYDLFHRIEENRNVDEFHVNHLMLSIQRQNLLQSFPILVTKTYGILDGQNRHEAARRLRVPIFYMIAQDEMTVDDVATVAGATKKWTLDDFLARYVNAGKHDYVVFADFIERAKSNGVKLGITVAMEICNYGQVANLRRAFKSGLFEANDMAFAERVLSRLIDWKELTPFASSNSVFQRAIANLEAQRDYDHERMMAKVKLVPTRVKNCATTAEFIDMLSDIYNYKVRVGAEVVLRMMVSQHQNYRIDRKS